MRMMNHLTTMKLSQCFMILNVTPRVTWEDVKKSYHQLAIKYHPDLNPRNLICENKFKELTSAFRILETHYKNPKGNGRQRVSSNISVRPQSYAKDSLFSTEANEEHHSNLSKTPGADKERKSGWSRWLQSLQVSFNKFERKIFLLDRQKNIRIVPHTAANGGIIRLRNRKETFQVKIPSGDWNRMSLRIPEKGESSFFGKKRGDLVLNIQVIQSEQSDAGRSKFFYELHISRENIKSSKVQTLDSFRVR